MIPVSTEDSREIRSLFQHRSSRSYAVDTRKVRRGEERVTGLVTPVLSPQPLTTPLFARVKLSIP